MSNPNNFAADFSYVRRALTRPVGTPAAIPILWAALGAPGFALVDLAPAAVPWYWLVAAPLGVIASIRLGRRAGERRGAIDRSTDLRWLWHWVGLLISVTGFVLVAAVGLVPFQVLNPTIVLLLAVAYFLAGIHDDHRLLWVAAALAAGFPIIAVVPQFGWTIAGGLVALSLVGMATPIRWIARG